MNSNQTRCEPNRTKSVGLDESAAVFPRPATIAGAVASTVAASTRTRTRTGTACVSTSSIAVSIAIAIAIAVRLGRKTRPSARRHTQRGRPQRGGKGGREWNDGRGWVQDRYGGAVARDYHRSDGRGDRWVGDEAGDGRDEACRCCGGVG
ncbi:hypothetical protein BD289DRAFT_437147 [Coniella lustricola]|uniref:Uncharacterized protein n=1 Tax=Coniella lustricola TaxID=2025994 RepID=A0A2T3A4E7_9PEZI|nr:hypothetical protein BD289DRAFT_437147 [Coniella lustricola]